MQFVADGNEGPAHRQSALVDFGFSVEAVIDQTLLDVCRGERIFGYRQVRLSTFGRLRSAGFALLGSFDHPISRWSFPT